MLVVEELSCFVLERVSLSLEDGEVVALSGASGSGKTRLLRAIADLDVNRGRVELDGRPREDFSPAEWRRRVGLLPAESGWWAPVVGAHFRDPAQVPFEALGLPRAARGWRVERLSSGERQRLALLRLLENRPRVLLLDEPTANLDPSAREQVEALVREQLVKTGAAALWVSHDQAQIERIASRHLCLVEGRLRQVAAA
ncbi:MAG TPA: ATP-binding cassette domain-containing protein [Gammaproteobacteria bacterium]|nr:ATP-binding cassette domain-containing protein [Gammaproteobacteria bacterium]